MLREFLENVSKPYHDKAIRDLVVTSFVNAKEIIALCRRSDEAVIFMSDGSIFYSSEDLNVLSQRFNS